MPISNHASTINEPCLPYATGLDVMESHLLRRTHLANTRSHQLCWGDQEVGTAISSTECSQVAGLIQKSVETLRKHCLFVHAVLYG